MAIQKEVSKFENKELGLSVDVYEIHGEPMFDAMAVARMLGYERPDRALKQLKQEFDEALSNNGGSQPLFHTIEIEGYRKGSAKKLKVFGESAFYKLALSSKKREAIRLQFWVASEVLPTIRKHGGYISDHASPEQLVDLEAQVKLWKTRALAKREEAAAIVQERDLWENRARNQKEQVELWIDRTKAAQKKRKVRESDYTLTKDHLLGTIESSIKAIESSNCKQVKEQKAKLKEAVKNIPKKLDFKLYELTCRNLLNIIGQSIEIIEENRNLGWSKHFESSKKLASAEEQALFRVVLAQQEGRMREYIEDYLERKEELMKNDEYECGYS